MPDTAPRPPLLAGILVGGRSSRMGGTPKGLLRAPSGETIVERLRAMLDTLGVASVLVGAHQAYDPLGFERIADDPPGIGPLGGLIGLFGRAGDGYAIALACDMPHVSAATLAKLAFAPAGAAAIAARRGDRWEPLFARYAAREALLCARARAAHGARALQGLLDDLGAVPIALSEEENRELVDWDSPHDVADEAARVGPKSEANAGENTGPVS